MYLTTITFNSKKYLSQFLKEDLGRGGDITSALLPRKKIAGKIITRQSAIIAGTVHAAEIFALKKCSTRILCKDGSRAESGQGIIKVTGDARNVLMCERTALNLLARMSGIATQTSRMVEKIPKGVELYSTRKTAPGLRYFDKEAVQIGGGMKHRHSLDEMVMIKDNHIAASGGRACMTKLIRRAISKHKRIEVEVENISDAVLAAREGATIIMLDNFSPAQIVKAVHKLENIGLRGGVTLEASGGIDSKNISRYSTTGVDMISVGSITSSVKGIDMSLEIV